MSYVAQALSTGGRCKTFDMEADGYGRGEGFAVFILQPESSISPLSTPTAYIQVRNNSLYTSVTELMACLSVRPHAACTDETAQLQLLNSRNLCERVPFQDSARMLKCPAALVFCRDPQLIKMGDLAA